MKPRQRRNPPSPIDMHVGTRLRMRRMMLGLSQEKLAVAFGLSFQQVQKYEKGVNRMGASRLQQAADILYVQVPFFFRRRRRRALQGRWERSIAGLSQRVPRKRRRAPIGESVHAHCTTCGATSYPRVCERVGRRGRRVKPCVAPPAWSGRRVVVTSGPAASCSPGPGTASAGCR